MCVCVCVCVHTLTQSSKSSIEHPRNQSPATQETCYLGYGLLRL